MSDKVFKAFLKFHAEKNPGFLQTDENIRKCSPWVLCLECKGRGYKKLLGKYKEYSDGEGGIWPDICYRCRGDGYSKHYTRVWKKLRSLWDLCPELIAFKTLKEAADSLKNRKQSPYGKESPYD